MFFMAVYRRRGLYVQNFPEMAGMSGNERKDRRYWKDFPRKDRFLIKI